MKIHEKFMKIVSIVNRSVPSGWMDGQTDMTKIIVAFRNFVNAHKNGSFIILIYKTVPVHGTARPYATEYIECYLNLFPTGKL
jgi:hypothetical protein